MASVLQNLGSALVTLAPTVAGLFLGPLGATGVAEAEKVFGLVPPAGSTLDARAAALSGALAQATPDQIIALKQADDALKAKFADAGVQLAQLDVQDRASARAMEQATKDSTPKVLTYLIALACAGIAGVIVGGFSPAFKDPTTAATIGTIVGYLFSELKAATAYWFGSSSGSDQKNALISKAMDSTPPAA